MLLHFQHYKKFFVGEELKGFYCNTILILPRMNNNRSDDDEDDDERKEDNNNNNNNRTKDESRVGFSFHSKRPLCPLLPLVKSMEMRVNDIIGFDPWVQYSLIKSRKSKDSSKLCSLEDSAYK